MTAQINDSVRYAGEDWALAGVNGGPLFDPTEFGLEPRATSSICWRGYTCEYELRDDQLFLEPVNINLDGTPPVLLGREPETRRTELGCAVSYRNLQAPLPFTGGLLLARDFIRKHYVHMGFHPAWKYAEVIEAELDAGHVVRFLDCSRAMAEIRQRLAGKDRPDGASRQEVALWIERTFARRY
jgi:hypothetical protein